MKKGDKLTDVELTELNHLMKANQNDPVFATNFYKQVGQEGTLQLYGQLALQTTDASDERKALLQQMQRNMGTRIGRDRQQVGGAWPWLGHRSHKGAGCWRRHRLGRRRHPEQRHGEHSAGHHDGSAV